VFQRIAVKHGAHLRAAQRQPEVTGFRSLHCVHAQPAGLVRRAGHQEIVRDRLRRELHSGLARRTGLDPQTPFEQIVARIREGSPGRADEIAVLDAHLRRRLHEPELVRTVARVAALLREEAT